jgi:hypothetical protein
MASRTTDKPSRGARGRRNLDCCTRPDALGFLAWICSIEALSVNEGNVRIALAQLLDDSRNGVVAGLLPVGSSGLRPWPQPSIHRQLGRGI